MNTNRVVVGFLAVMVASVALVRFLGRPEQPPAPAGQTGTLNLHYQGELRFQFGVISKPEVVRVPHGNGSAWVVFWHDQENGEAMARTVAGKELGEVGPNQWKADLDRAE